MKDISGNKMPAGDKTQTPSYKASVLKGSCGQGDRDGGIGGPGDRGDRGPGGQEERGRRGTGMRGDRG